MITFVLIIALILSKIATMKYGGNDFLGYITTKKRGLDFPDFRGAYLKNPKIFKKLLGKLLLFCGIEIIITILIILEVFIL